MSRANIHRRNTLEQVYPADAFSHDAAQNGVAANELVRGVRILSAPDAVGEFGFEQASRHIVETSSAAFLAPYRREDRPINAGLDGPAALDPREEYEAFLADVVAAAQQFGFKPEETPGRDEPRLRGLRQ
jgi:hypothetical protein